MQIEGNRRIAADAIGYSIAALLAMLLYPQVRKTLKHKHTLGLSKKTIILNILISVLGVVYSILIGEYPLLTGEGLVFLFSVWLAVLYMKYRDNTDLLRTTYNSVTEASSTVDATGISVVTETPV